MYIYIYIYIHIHTCTCIYTEESKQSGQNTNKQADAPAPRFSRYQSSVYMSTVHSSVPCVCLLTSLYEIVVQRTIIIL